ncbi:MAG: sigma 54-interacting transcriptional regulator [Deltaproteobacteria bacterium]|nr:sigma 54-interacting transcriptional regulator [Deltaproteobacteria bacterium]
MNVSCLSERKPGYLEHIKKTVLDFISIMMIDREGFITYANDNALSILGNDVEFEHFNCSHINEIFRNDVMQVISTGNPQVGMYPLMNTVMILSSNLPVKEDNFIVGAMCIFQPLPDQDNTSHRLHMLKHFDAVIESSSDGIYITDGQANTLLVNSAYEKMTGINRKEVLGRNMQDLVKEGFFDESVTLKVLKTKKKETLLQKLWNGKELLVTGNPLFDDDGNIAMVVTNDRDMSELINLHQALEQTQGMAMAYKETLHTIQQADMFGKNFVVANKRMQEICDIVDRVSKTDATVIFYGETGVGKDCLAEEIHKRSLRFNRGLFVKINCGAIPETLLESELFGYKGGAFTGARKEGKVGLFEVANGGTILLDEIECLPMSLQPKLLNVLQNFEITRIGSTNPKKIDIRIICTSNQNLKDMVERNEFRADLYYRLDVVSVTIPPLRDRKEDIPPLIHHFLNYFNSKYEKNKIITPKTMGLLLGYSWPGNVREVANVIEKLVVITIGDKIMCDDLPRKFREQHDDYSQPITNLKFYLEKAEINMIEKAVKFYGSARKAAPVLGIHHSTITRKLQRISGSFDSKVEKNIP